MRYWPSLKKGDLVDLVAPGYPADLKMIEAGVKELESWGLQVRMPIDLIRPYYFHSQTDARRLEILTSALFNQQSKAVWCVRGGYGAGRLLPGLLKKNKPKNLKLFIGISDNTVLHFFLNQKWKWQTLHGPIVERLGSKDLPQDIVDETKSIVFGDLSQVDFGLLRPMNILAEKRKKISGTILGGNLATMQTLIGTDLHPKTKKSILFLEDIGERGYSLDRMFVHFKQAGLFDAVAAVVLGHFIGGDEPDKNSFVQFSLERLSEDLKIPVFSGLEAGHGVRQRPLPLGVNAKIYNSKLSVQLNLK